MSRGFSLLELLIATAIATAFAAAIATVVPSLQAFFEHTPAAIDLQQRGRTAVDVIAQAIRSADKIVLADEDPDHDYFRRLTAIAPRVNAAQGVLAEDQVGAGGDLALSEMRCPNVPDVCGFVRGTVAVISDTSGRFEVFTVGSSDGAMQSISPRRRFDEPYAADATVLEVDANTFRLEPQPDGSFTLVRETGAGAVQPIVDRVSDVRFERTFDVRGIDITLTLQSHRAGGGESTRRLAVVARNVR
ncbi:MAG TPA: prepilin-type N-terminal cleavage/methylation domain-containing protein [Vicinamibacterales bacterium]|nr:prepilin-type N-terminal cleavage/methylation domain-containing protein [Vicinamibacterales bacterium]